MQFSKKNTRLRFPLLWTKICIEFNSVCLRIIISLQKFIVDFVVAGNEVNMFSILDVCVDDERCFFASLRSALYLSCRLPARAKNYSMFAAGHASIYAAPANWFCRCVAQPNFQRFIGPITIIKQLIVKMYFASNSTPTVIPSINIHIQTITTNKKYSLV